MKNTEEAVTGEVDELVETLIAKSTNTSIAVKLRNMHDVCRTIVLQTKQRLTVPEILRQYKARFPDVSQTLSEQTIRNNRPNGNPYQTLYRKWEIVAERVLVNAAPATARSDGEIIAESEIRKITDVTLRHQVFLLFAQNRSLHNQLNIIKQAATNAPIQISGGTQPFGGADLVLTESEVDAVRDFIDPRKLRARHLARTKDDGVCTSDGRPVADAGFVSALDKIVRSHQRS
ncbi:gamma-mobile-trio protein GmtX [Microbacteriaceae bacterium K1510]|nr:gamma-mobile-trio protein GmtX [Microbacteriaceae bacterium K1510]